MSVWDPTLRSGESSSDSVEEEVVCDDTVEGRLPFFIALHSISLAD
jgi:hypothetical protein